MVDYKMVAYLLEIISALENWDSGSDSSLFPSVDYKH